LSNWTQHDPEAFYDWALAAPDQLTGREYLARLLAELRPELAKLAVDRLPADLQNAWIPSVASGLAVVSMNDALQWLSRYQGRPIYGQAVSAALGWASTMARWEDPPALASFLDTQSVDVRAESIALVANAWAQRDPAAAARWVERVALSDATEDRRLPAIANVARRWVERNAEAAEEWALGLPAGAARDEALGTVLSVTSEAGRVETRLLRAFSSDLAAQQQVARIMGNLGRSDPELGRELIRRYITDAALRAQAEQGLVRGVSGESSSMRGLISVR
jgi:hypothetical protein